MALIDPDGLYNGRRLRKCSDRARLYWPYFFLAANGLGRIEIDPDYLIRTCFPGFEQPPSEEEVWEFFREYRDQHLIFLYGVGDQVWGQWYCKPGSLPRWKTRKDHDSPEPPEKEYQTWEASYNAESKALPKSLLNLPKTDRKLPKNSAGVGVGSGVGSGVEKAEATAKSPPRRRDTEMLTNVAALMHQYFEGHQRAAPDLLIATRVHDALGEPCTWERIVAFRDFISNKLRGGFMPDNYGIFLSWAEMVCRQIDELEDDGNAASGN